MDIGEADRAMNAILRAYLSDATIYVFGNGGSASTASHLLNDLNKGVGYRLPKKFRVRCLNDNVAMLTALANDVGYPAVFAAQLEGLLAREDLVIAISSSGNSANVIQATKYAKDCGCCVLALTGRDGGELGKLADFLLRAPSDDTQIVEDIHLVFNHMVMKIFCRVLGG